MDRDKAEMMMLWTYAPGSLRVVRAEGTSSVTLLRA
jgi:hypothetical protein